MAIRYLKIVFVVFIALLCLFYGGQNVANLGACYETFAYVLGAADHQAYPDSFFPAIRTPALIWLTLALVVTFEFAAGLLATKGAWDLWTARQSSATDFNAAKTYALVGCGMGVIVWFGLFAVFGGALFQMWQTDIGGASMDDSFQFFAACALIFLIVNTADE